MANEATIRPILRLTPPTDYRKQLAVDVRAGLTAEPKRIPTKYHYDERGSRLFEEITQLPEYYLTRKETQILEGMAADLMSASRPHEIVELGAGYARKTEILLEGMFGSGAGRDFVPFDVSEEAIVDASARLASKYPWLEIRGVVGDFRTDLALIPREGRRMIGFLGSTVGNLNEAEIAEFYREATAMLRDGDRLLVGYDLVKDVEVMEAAYNDRAGVTEQFSKNVLRVINRELDGDFPLDRFKHVSSYNESVSRIESGLQAIESVDVTVGDLNMEVSLEEGEVINTEVSAKFTRERVQSDIETGGLTIDRWMTDDDGMFALALIAQDGG